MAQSFAPAVRAFAAEQGLTVGSRGKFSAEVIDAFNKANPRAKYVQGSPVLVAVPVPAKDARGRNRTAQVKVNRAETRAWAVAQGLAVSEKGRLPKAVVQAHAEAVFAQG